MKIVFDLDGTLALTAHRDHFLRGEKKDWAAFYAACDGDQPNWPVISTMRALSHLGHEIEIWTGRSAEVAVKTYDWLRLYGMANMKMLMRPVGDHCEDITLKRRWYDEAERKPNLVFEDRTRVVYMWRALGVACFQVADGAF